MVDDTEDIEPPEYPHLAAYAKAQGLTVVRGYAYDGTAYRPPFLGYSDGDIETLVHELGHWALATSEERQERDWGMNSLPFAITDLIELMCLKLERAVFRVAQVELIVAHYYEDYGPALHRKEQTTDLTKHPRWVAIPPDFIGSVAQALRADVVIAHPDLLGRTA